MFVTGQEAFRIARGATIVLDAFPSPVVRRGGFIRYVNVQVLQEPVDAVAWSFNERPSLCFVFEYCVNSEFIKKGEEGSLLFMQGIQKTECDTAKGRGIITYPQVPLDFTLNGDFFIFIG